MYPEQPNIAIRPSNMTVLFCKYKKKSQLNINISIKFSPGQNRSNLTGLTYSSKLTARNKAVLRNDRRPSPGVVSRIFLLIVFPSTIYFLPHLSCKKTCYSLNNITSILKLSVFIFFDFRVYFHGWTELLTMDREKTESGRI